MTVKNPHGYFQLIRIDISTVGDMDSNRPNEIDTALRVKYAPAKTRHLLVTTAQNKLIKLDASNGKVLSEVCKITYISKEIDIIYYQ